MEGEAFKVVEVVDLVENLVYQMLVTFVQGVNSTIVEPSVSFRPFTIVVVGSKEIDHNTIDVRDTVCDSIVLAWNNRIHCIIPNDNSLILRAYSVVYCSYLTFNFDANVLSSLSFHVIDLVGLLAYFAVKAALLSHTSSE